MNYLQYEKSPYLRQHMNNPVNWYSWNEEAFEAAKKEDKPVFLSIGYSTCHWCHVMAHESFEDTQVAEILNENYISIKVDREERPDVDAVYMAVCQALTGSGGWPLTILMTPEQKPFFAGTYFPKRQRYGQPGFVEILRKISELWKNGREELLRAGNQVYDFMQNVKQTDAAVPDQKLLQRAFSIFQSQYDKKWGGFGSAPKFPVPHNLMFLLRCSVLEVTSVKSAHRNSKKDAMTGQGQCKTGSGEEPFANQYLQSSAVGRCKTGLEEEALQMAERTLTAMARGGIFDQIGGGFSRYSTDEKWLAPHFEKMLYDNALLATTYLEAWQVTKNPLFEDVAVRTLDYMIRELSDEKGGFYCGQDADSDGEEGKYYLFTREEVIGVLGQEDGEEFCRIYDITKSGNFEGRSIPNRIGCDDSLWKAGDARLKKLYEYRKERTKLHTDDKIILSWNAWAICAFAKAAHILGEKKYLEAALRTHKFIQNCMTDKDGKLFLRWCRGGSRSQGDIGRLCRLRAGIAGIV